MHDRVTLGDHEDVIIDTRAAEQLRARRAYVLMRQVRRIRMRLSIVTRLVPAAIVALTLVPSPSRAQTVDDIVAKHIAARGGRDKLKAVQTLKLTRTVANGIGNPIRLIVYKKRPSLYRSEQGPVQAGATLIPRGINAENAWDLQQGKPVARAAQAAAETRDVDADFDGIL